MSRFSIPAQVGLLAVVVALSAAAYASFPEETVEADLTAAAEKSAVMLHNLPPAIRNKVMATHYGN